MVDCTIFIWYICDILYGRSCMKTDTIWEGRETMKDGLARQHPWVRVVFEIMSGTQSVRRAPKGGK